MAEHSLARVNELKEWGFFESPLYNNCFNKPIKERNISVLERIVKWTPKTGMAGSTSTRAVTVQWFY